jgi:hypothetical protein
MLDVFGPRYDSCDRLSRRSFLRVGTLGLAGLTLADHLRLRAAAKQEGRSTRDTAVILVWLGGGPSHIDTYDLKPNAPSEIRGEFKPIKTNVSGIQISEHLPLGAKVMDKVAVVRSAWHTNAGHGMGSHWMLTGYVPTIEINDNLHPSCGSVVAKMRGSNKPHVPPYVCLPSPPPSANAAYLGVAYNPFSPGGDPSSPSFEVRDLKLPRRVSCARTSTSTAPPRAWTTSSARRSTSSRARRPARRSTSTRRTSDCATATAATAGGSRPCWRGAWSRPESPTSR